MSASHPDQWEFVFSLNEECQFTDVKGLRDIQLKFKDVGPNSKLVTGFHINVEGYTQNEALSTANEHAKRLTDLLALECGKHLRYQLSGYTKINPHGKQTVGKTVTMDAILIVGKPIDLSKGILASLIKNNSDLTQRLHHANQGLEAAKNKLYEIMIKEFYLVIDGVFPQNSTKFMSLRDVLSHHGQLRQETIQRLNQDFGTGYFEFTSKNGFDHNSPNNIAKLKVESRALMEIAMRYLLNKIH